ncbi:epithelial-stromal interaction protein 1 isoform X4 [Notamacropus eugenii]|uniref:epithelial-stromal interaction protein 1 isoform X4 n=1 Tax=Notamacropus eugenii TaxID=9315 RepID=UPI003B67567B
MSSRTRASFSSWESAGGQPELGLPHGQRQGAGAAGEAPTLESSSPGQRTQVHMAGFTVIAPNQIRRDKITRIANKELEDLENWKQQQRCRPIHTTPNKLGGNQSEAEARKKQQCQLFQSKYQQKLKREECVRLQKEEEEAKIQAIKAIQREKSNKLEEKRRVQEKQRREAFNDQPPCKSSEFLSSLEPKAPTRSCRQTSYPDTIWSELLELKRQGQEEGRTEAHRREQRRVNNAFLDRIQGKSQPSGLHQFGGFGNMNCGKGWGV